jgi:hypothetical protein
MNEVMELADAWLTLYPGHEVKKDAITPAELLVLQAFHGSNAKGEAVRVVKTIGYAQTIEKPAVIEKDEKGREVVVEKAVYRPRSAREEVGRLYQIYGGPVDNKGIQLIAAIFPDKLNPRVPLTFADAKQAIAPLALAPDLGDSIGGTTNIPGKLPAGESINIKGSTKAA